MLLILFLDLLTWLDFRQCKRISWLLSAFRQWPWNGFLLSRWTQSWISSTKSVWLALVPCLSISIQRSTVTASGAGTAWNEAGGGVVQVGRRTWRWRSLLVAAIFPELRPNSTSGTWNGRKEAREFFYLRQIKNETGHTSATNYVWKTGEAI